MRRGCGCFVARSAPCASSDRRAVRSLSAPGITSCASSPTIGGVCRRTKRGRWFEISWARIEDEPDSRTNASFGSGSHTVRFSSTHEQLLFQLLGPLRHLDPDRAASIAGRYPQLSAAAEQFPYGQESMNEAARAERPPIPREPVEQPQYIDVGRRLIPIPEAIRTEFEDAFRVAFGEDAADSDPEQINDAPQICWPSAFEFRKILYHAGRHEGRAATRYLDRIPDPALRLFAQIECAAALAGLPPLGGRTIARGRAGLQDMVRAWREGAPRWLRMRTNGCRRPILRCRSPGRLEDPASSLRAISASRRPRCRRTRGRREIRGPIFVEVRNATLKAVVSTLHEVSEARIDWPSSLDPNARGRFRARAAASGKPRDDDPADAGGDRQTL